MNQYQILSEERKQLQADGTAPQWMTTAGWQLMKSRYLYGEEVTPSDAYRRVANHLATFLPVSHQDHYAQVWYEYMWKGWLAPSTPVLSNAGTDRGCPVSCSGGYVEDSIYGFYSAELEAAMLSKNGFGISSYLGDIRPRGSAISTGGSASGALPVIKEFVEVSKNVTQGGIRRGAWAGYLPVDHGDFDEVVNYLLNNPDDFNLGWNIPNSFIDRLEVGDPEAIRRFKRMLYVKAITGKGYFFFVDKVNARNPLDLPVLASNLCTEITLPSSLLYTFTCVLSSLNAALFDEWKDHPTFVADCVLFLDCVAEAFIAMAKTKKGLEKAVAYTERYRSLGLGVLGFHTYLQKKNVAFEELQAMWINAEIFECVSTQAREASVKLGEWLGIPEGCQHLGRRNSHLMAIAPNTSSALLCGGVSQGVEGIAAVVYNQNMAGGEVARINPVFLALAKEKGVYDSSLIDDIINHKGSVQHLDWLTDHEKLVFKTAFEINQEAVIRLASQRQQWIDQAQSLNLFFSADEDEEWIARVHAQAFRDPNILSLYYMRTQAGVLASKDCIACEG